MKSRKWYAERLRVSAKRHRISIFNYFIGEDGVHLVCAARNPDMISTMMQDLQSSTSKKFARKRGGESSMWQGRFKATLIHGGIWLKQCMLLLDLQIIAIGRCNHPAEWGCSGWHELVGIKKRYRVISTSHATGAWGIGADINKFRSGYVQAIEVCRTNKSFGCLTTWTDALAVGPSGWIADVSVSIPERCKTIRTVPMSASPLNDGGENTVTLQTSTKRRRGYLGKIFRQLTTPA
jgi:putative transposase